MVEINVLIALSWIAAAIIFFLMTRVAQRDDAASWLAYALMVAFCLIGIITTIQTIIEKFS